MAQKKTKSKGRPYAPAPKNTGLKVLSLLLAALFIAAGIGCAVGWVKVSKLEKQINSQLPSDGDNTGNEEGGGSLVVKPSLTCDSISLDVQPYSDEGAFFITETEEDGSVSYVSAEGICSITATVYDINGSVNEELQSVTWEISNAEAGVTMTVDGMTATFECVPEGFSEQIIVTCTSTIDPEKFETITLDYAMCISEFRYTHLGKNGKYNCLDKDNPLPVEPIINVGYVEQAGWFVGANMYFIENFKYVGSIGTIKDEVRKVSVEIDYSEKFKQVAINAITDILLKYEINANIDNNSFSTVNQTFDTEGNEEGVSTLFHKDALYLANLITGAVSEQGLFNQPNLLTDYPEIWKAYISSFYGLTKQMEVAVTFDYKYRGEVTYNYAVTVVLDNYSPIGSVSTGGNNSVIFH